jgi:hypothetical protein
MQILPNAKSQFIDSAGQPLASGTVGFYFPGTLNPKATFQDSAGTIANTNPVQLDSRGQAIIWGNGIYRQIVKDASGVTIWDQITEDPNAGLTGDLTDNLFVAGTNFTPGTTTQLTLTTAPGSVQNMWVYFDGTYQADNQLSLSGTTLTFNSPIPVGVTLVTVKIGTTIAIGTPGTGAVTDASVAANAGINSTKLAYIEGDAGSLSRTVQSKLRERISVKDFGAKGDGITDDSAAFQVALNTAISQNSRLVIPSGCYIIGTPLVAQFSNVSGGLNDHGRRPRIEGDGSEDTLLFYTGASASPVLSVIGAGDFVDLMTVKGFRINRPFATPAGVGLLVSTTIHGVIEDIAITGFDTGLQLTDVNSMKLVKVSLSGNNLGFLAQQGTVTPPNLIEWDSCAFDSNIKSAGTSLLGTVVAFRNCSFEGNGNGTAATLTLTYNGGTGCAASSFYNNYFEGNFGPADIFQVLVNPMPHGNMVVEGNVFDKIDATKFVTNHIFIDASALGAVGSPFNAQIRGNGFFNGGLVPHNPAIVQAPGGSGYFGFRSNDMLNDNTFSFASEQPAVTPSSLIDGEAVCQISSAGVLSNSLGVTTCTKTGPGLYVLTIPQLPSAALVSVTPNTSGIAMASGLVISATQVAIQTANGTGAAADFATTVRVKML